MLKLKIFLRSIFRKIGLNNLIAKIFFSKGYEEKFNKAMIDSISPGDVICDIGANIGHYTSKFASATGKNGIVYGFEPMPETYKILVKNVQNINNVHLVCCAISVKDDNLTMTLNDEVGSATNKIIDNSES